MSIAVFAQKEESFSGHYYGNKSKLGELEFINDSLYRVAFYFYGVGWQEYDTGYYRKKDDTIFLTSMEKTAFELIEDYYVKNDYIDCPERYPNVIFPRTFLISHYTRGYKLSFLQNCHFYLERHKSRLYPYVYRTIFSVVRTATFSF